MRKGISVVIPVKNEKKNLKKLLPSLFAWVNEILIMDDFSTDNTKEIVKQFDRKVRYFPETPWNMNESVNKGFDAASYNWILHLDADERIPEKLKNEILQIVNGNYDDMATGYEISRIGYIGKKAIKSCGWYPDYAVRLVKKGQARHPEIIHEPIKVYGRVKKLKEPMLHYSYKDISQYLQKFNLYTSWLAKHMLDGEIRKGRVILKIFLKFPYKYFIQKGFLDGIYGFLISFLDSSYYLIGYLKYIEMKRKKVKKFKG